MGKVSVCFLSADHLQDATAVDNCNLFIFSLIGYVDYNYCDVLLCIDDVVYGMDSSNGVYTKKSHEVEAFDLYDTVDLHMDDAEYKSLQDFCKESVEAQIPYANVDRIAFGRIPFISIFIRNDIGMSPPEYVSHCLKSISYNGLKDSQSYQNITTSALYHLLEKNK